MDDAAQQMQMMRDADPAPLMASTMETWRAMLEVDAARGTLPTDDQVRAATARAQARAEDMTLSDRARQVARVRVQCEASMLATLALFRSR